MSRIGISFDPQDSDLQAKAQTLAADLGLPLAQISQSDFDAFLVLTPHRLELRAAGSAQPGPVYVDFLAGNMRRRLRELTSTRQLIARAVGFKGSSLNVIDATAGLGRDAFLLACLGCNVTAVERSPVIAALLADGLDRAAVDSVVGPIARERIRLLRGDAREILAALAESDRPDVICIDPMFPHRTKSALVKKEMRLCRLVAGDDTDAEDLYRVALSVARSRVVVKRSLRAPALVCDPAFSYKGRTIRYDVYPVAQ